MAFSTLGCKCNLWHALNRRSFEDKVQEVTQLAIASLIAAISAPISQLKAATYAFNATDVVKSDPLASNGSVSAFPAVSISIQDSAVQSGSFSSTYVGSPASFRGDYTSLISFNIGNAIAVTPTSGDASTFRANLLFDTDGSVSAGAIFYSGASFAMDLAGSSSLFQGVFDPTDTGGQGFVSGTLTAVSEPTSIALLIAGFFGLALIKQHASLDAERRYRSYGGLAVSARCTLAGPAWRVRLGGCGVMRLCCTK